QRRSSGVQDEGSVCRCRDTRARTQRAASHLQTRPKHPPNGLRINPQAEGGQAGHGELGLPCDAPAASSSRTAATASAAAD
ncbi:unnamed protein product, partial [Lampetra fluviatilis]